MNTKKPIKTHPDCFKKGMWGHITRGNRGIKRWRKAKELAREIGIEPSIVMDLVNEANIDGGLAIKKLFIASQQ